MNYIVLAIAIVAEVTATTALKQSESFTKPLWAAITVGGYALAFYCLSISLKTIPTGIAYAIWSGVGMVLIAALAWVFQGQKLDAAAIAGIGLIISGVAVMNLCSKVGGQ